MTDKRTLCAEEREVVIQFDDSTKTASAYSCSKSWREKLKKLQRDNPSEVKVITDDSTWGAYEIEFVQYNIGVIYSTYGTYYT